jgi:hypothetical protein
MSYLNLEIKQKRCKNKNKDKGERARDAAVLTPPSASLAAAFAAGCAASAGLAATDGTAPVEQGRSHRP